MKKATATAPANIAFIKYWGKVDQELRLPLNSSISMNLSACATTTTVEFSDQFEKDAGILLDKDKTYKLQRPHNFVGFGQQEIKRIIEHLDRLRKMVGLRDRVKVVTQNSFPKSSGVASSASGFAALTVAAAAALGLKLSEKELSILARLGSGSACRSIPDGFVEWKKGISSAASYAYSLYPHDYWDLRDILVIVDYRMKKVSTTEGQKNVKTSPLWQDRVNGIPEKIEKIKKALKEKNFQKLGELVEEDCLSMHRVMQTQDPPLFYWNEATKTIMEAVRVWRKNGLAVYFTIDAGPNVHLICEGKDEDRVIKAVKAIKAVKEIIVNQPAAGARLTKSHLF